MIGQIYLDVQTIVAIISAVTALVAVVVGPLFSVRIGRNRARFEAVVLERVEMMRDMRRTYSEFVSSLMIANADRGLGRLSHSDASQKLERAFRLETELTLILDATREQDRIVLENITAARNRVFKDLDFAYDPHGWERHYYAAHAALLEVMKAEREKIARLE